MTLNDLDVFGLGALGCLFDLEAHPLAFSQGLKTIALNGCVMDEKVLSVILLDKAIALLLVEPFHLTFSHCDIPPFCLLLLGTSPDIALANKKGHRELCDISMAILSVSQNYHPTHPGPFYIGP